MKTSAVLMIVACTLPMSFPETCSAQAKPPADGLTADVDAIRRWQEMRFGLFIHWGPVSLTGREIGWSRAGERRGHRSKRGTQTPVEVYDNLYKKFNPVKFDADEWVRIAKDAGMKYLVFTTKHHDGFCNFDSKLTDYKITDPDSPYGKDIVKQLADACHKGGLALGWYYSPPDWYDANYRNGDRHAKYIEYMHGQVRELLTGYGKVDIMWFDGLGGRSEDWNAPPLLKTIRKLQPGIVINNRCGLPADYDTPEQRVGGFSRLRPWETCMTICHQWAWKPDDKMKSLGQCIQTLLHVVGGDGNFLFNVGPMPDGRIEPRQVERLKEMGAWLKKYGQTVYGTRGGPFEPGKWGASTCKDDIIYLHVMRWPNDGPLKLPSIPAKITATKVLTGGQATISQTGDGTAVSLPETARDEIATVIQLTIDGKAFGIEPISIPAEASGSLLFGKKATASNVFHRQNARYGPAKAIDDDPETRWATDAGTSEAWLEVDIGTESTFGRVHIDERQWNRVRKFELQYKDGQQWRTALTGTTIGGEFTKRFAPVTARNVRLNILEATEGPTIWEFQLFGPSK